MATARFPPTSPSMRSTGRNLIRTATMNCWTERSLERAKPDTRTSKLAMMLRPALRPGFVVAREMSYILQPDTRRAAGVAPELVVEVVSPANRSSHDMKPLRSALQRRIAVLDGVSRRPYSPMCVHRPE
jgi:hypothetical protein